MSLRDPSRAATPVKLTDLSFGGNAYSRNGLEISWLAIDETGTELVWELRKRFSDFTGNVFGCTNRVIEYRALAGHAPLNPGGITVAEGMLIKSIALPDLNERCRATFGPATFSPFKGSIAGARRTAPISAPLTKRSRD